MAGAAVLLSTTRCGSASPRENNRRAYTEGDYHNALVIDALGTLDDPITGELPESPPSERLLRDLQLSGVTALSVTLSVGTEGNLFDKVLRKIALMDEKVAAAPAVLTRIRTISDLKSARQTRHIGLIYNIQNTLLLESDLSRVAILEALGLRQVQLTYNVRNAAGDGCLEPSNAGLSNFGRELIGELEARRLVVDLSHASQRTISEGITRAHRPPIISHTGCRDVTNHPRNVFDTELRALADKGGVAGIYFMPFLTSSGTASASDLIRHLEHAINVCGEEHVGLGTDGRVSEVVLDEAYRDNLRRELANRRAQGIAAPGEGAKAYELIPEYNGPLKFLGLARDLSRRGWPARRIERVLGANFARVYGEVWGER